MEILVWLYILIPWKRKELKESSLTVLNVQIVCKTLERLDLQITNTNSSLLSNNVCAEYENKLKTKLIKQSKPNKITTTAEI